MFNKLYYIFKYSVLFVAYMIMFNYIFSDLELTANKIIKFGDVHDALNVKKLLRLLE